MLIDCHQHVNFRGYNADLLVKYFDSIGVGKAWLLTWESIDGSLEPSYQHISIEDTYAAYKKYPTRFIPFYAIDPRREDAEKRLEYWVKRGIKGYGELKIRACIDNPDSERMYNICGDSGLPVLLHMDVPLPDNPTFWYNYDIDGLEKMLKKCKKTIFIGHGPGFWREISKDANRKNTAYPKGKIIPGGKLPMLLEKYPNIYADISAGSGYNALVRDEEFGVKFVKKFYAKILYGTDGHDDQHIKYLRRLNLKGEIFSAITHRNAEGLIKK